MTLFELLIVLSILALLATLVAPRVVGYLGQAKSDVAAAQMASIATGLDLYALDMGRFPTEAEGLRVLIDAPENGLDWAGPYLREADGLQDPWGNPYGYTLSDNGTIFEVISFGRDGQEGGVGEDADLVKK